MGYIFSVSSQYLEFIDSSDGFKNFVGLCIIQGLWRRGLNGGLRLASQLRRLMVQVAHSACRVRDSRFRLFYLHVAARRGKKKAIVALARKILCIIHRLLVNGGEYTEDGFVKRFRVRVKTLKRLQLEEMVGILRNAGYMVQAP